MFHLFGYDHMNEEDKAAMREKEELALAKAGLLREDSDSVLIQMARQAMEAAYVPYSHYQVGACLLCDDGRMFTGCNVENASYGLSLCAECGLVSDLIASGGGRLVAFSCCNKLGELLMPCGRCRQLLYEHGGPDLLVDTPAGVLPMREVLPQAFGPDDLAHVADHADSAESSQQ
ncbi:Cytidine deaminase [bioreactor metagenome]|uniref:cytidine deaminase n=1 Tax=bioreactor metagenome TaxID=1076179 RepID=A0A645G1D4_9ZZZZ